MKKFTLFTSVILFISVIIGAQSIKIISPRGGTWQQGQLLKIEWQKVGRMNQTIKIRLFNCKNKQKILGITNNAPNNGKFLWTIPNSIANGDYFIRVKTIDNKVSHDSKCITIMKKEAPKPPNNNTNGSNNNSNNSSKIYKLKEPNTYQLDPKYTPKENTFNPNFKPKNNARVTIGKITPSQEVVPIGTSVRLNMEFKNATKIKVTDKTSGKVIFNKPVALSNRNSTLSTFVIADKINAEYEMEVWGPKSTYLAVCWIKTTPTIKYFNSTENNGNRIFNYSFMGCKTAWLKRRPVNSNNWERVKKISAPYIFRPFEEISGKITVKSEHGKYKYLLVLIGQNGVVSSNEI